MQCGMGMGVERLGVTEATTGELDAPTAPTDYGSQRKLELREYVQSDDAKQLPSLGSLGLVAYSECHTLRRVHFVESVIHPFECIGRACSPTLLPKHGVRFPITVLIIVLTALVFKDKPELIWRWF